MNADPGCRRFVGRAALVTGGSSGIGYAVARRLAEEGATVTITSRSGASASTAAERLAAETGGEVRGVEADVRDCAAVDAATEAATVGGALHVAVANAGIERPAAFLEVELDDWEAVLATNLTGAFATVQSAARVMAAGGGGSVVVISSTNGSFVESNLTAYNASKAGLVGLVRSAAFELAPLGVRVNAVAPGLIHTPMTDSLVQHPEHARAYLDHIPLDRFGEPVDVAAAVAFLASSDASWVTGHELVVDGGQVIGMDVPLDTFGGAP